MKKGLKLRGLKMGLCDCKFCRYEKMIMARPAKKMSCLDKSALNVEGLK